MNSDKKGGDHQQQDQQQQQSQNSSKNTNRSTELTAEWTVHAQLTISRPDDQSTTDDRQNPVRVVYKWSSDGAKPTADEDQSKQQEASSFTPKDKHDSFHSTTTCNDKLPSDSGLSSSNQSRKPYSSRCKSTCSIVLSAVADFLPAHADIPEEPDPFYFHTTSTYNVLPDQTTDETTTASQGFGTSKTLSLRDAFCQTSDTESTALRSKMQQSSNRDETNQRKLYNYRRQTESMLPPPVVDEGDPFLPSFAKGSSQQPYYSSPSNLQQSPGGPFPTNTSLSRKNSGTEKSDSKKPPRTVHIDVYCTGSDVEDDDDDEVEDDASSQSSSNNPNEIESNSTPQTVFNTEQMRLRHQRAGRNELPRRLMAQNQHQQQQQMFNKAQKNQHQQQPSFPPANSQTHVYEPDSPPIMPHLGHVLSNSNTADEISESKQLLFKKHIGDQKNKLNFRNRYFRRDQSDDAISSNYPNSSRSTIRDMTCSSISSAIASSSAIYEDIDTSWKETEIEPEVATVTSVGKSDSFEYDNSVDRARIKKMERFWGLPIVPGSNELTIPQQASYNIQQRQRIQEFLQGYHGPPPRSYHDTLSSEYDNAFETDHPYLYNRPSIPERDESVEQQEPSVASQVHRMTLKPGFLQERESPPRLSPDPPRRLLYHQDYVKSSSETSTLQSNLSGYTSEYLQKARRFGSVVTALRKPGHHVGPSKNPDCQCEHCRRWMAERFEVRGRAYSTGDAPFPEPHYWLRRSTPGV